jgi:hypothetical protein
MADQNNGWILKGRDGKPIGPITIKGWTVPKVTKWPRMDPLSTPAAVSASSQPNAWRPLKPMVQGPDGQPVPPITIKGWTVPKLTVWPEMRTALTPVPGDDSERPDDGPKFEEGLDEASPATDPVRWAKEGVRNLIGNGVIGRSFRDTFPESSPLRKLVPMPDTSAAEEGRDPLLKDAVLPFEYGMRPGTGRAWAKFAAGLTTPKEFLPILVSGGLGTRAWVHSRRPGSPPVGARTFANQFRRRSEPFSIRRFGPQRDPGAIRSGQSSQPQAAGSRAVIAASPPERLDDP